MSATDQVQAREAAPEKTPSTNPLSKFSVQIVIGLVAGVVLGFVAAGIGQTADGDPNWLTATLAEIGGA